MPSTDTLAYHCPHCGELMEVPAALVDQTVACVHCHKPFRADAPRSAPVDKSIPGSVGEQTKVATPADDELLLETIHPAMFRNHPFVFLGIIGLFLLGVAGLLMVLAGRLGTEFSAWGVSNDEPGDQNMVLWISLIAVAGSALYLFAWWVQTRFTSLEVTTERTIFQRGLIARSTSEVRHDDVRNMRIHQTIVQRLLGVGMIAISSSGQDDFEIQARGIPSPESVVETIRSYQ